MCYHWPNSNVSIYSSLIIFSLPEEILARNYITHQTYSMRFKTIWQNVWSSFLQSSTSQLVCSSTTLSDGICSDLSFVCVFLNKVIEVRYVLMDGLAFIISVLQRSTGISKANFSRRPIFEYMAPANCRLFLSHLTNSFIRTGRKVFSNSSL